MRGNDSKGSRLANCPVFNAVRLRITLFTMYYSPEIMDLIIKKTNEYNREPKDDSCPRARAIKWYPTYRGELYVYFVIRIYITLYICNKIIDY
jgi:hypothetical protein